MSMVCREFEANVEEFSQADLKPVAARLGGPGAQ